MPNEDTFEKLNHSKELRSTQQEKVWRKVNGEKIKGHKAGRENIKSGLKQLMQAANNKT